jgi:hypothetical protein
MEPRNQRWYDLVNGLMMRPGMERRAAPRVVEVHVYDGTTRLQTTRVHNAGCKDTQRSMYEWATNIIREYLRYQDARTIYWQITEYDGGTAATVLTSNDTPPPKREQPRLYSYA